MTRQLLGHCTAWFVISWPLSALLNPFFAHHISSTVYGTSAVDVDAFPDSPLPEVAFGTDEGSRLCGLSTSLQEFNGQTWAAKKEQGISLNQPIEGVQVPDELSEFSATLTRMHQLS